MKVIKMDYRIEGKLNKGQVVHAITEVNDIEVGDTVCLVCGETAIKRRIVNLYPFVAFWNKHVWVVLVDFEPVVGAELYRIALDGGLIPGLFNKRIEKETKSGAALFLGQLVVWENMNEAYPFTPYVAKKKNKTVSGVKRRATKLMWQIEKSDKGRGLLSPILAYEYLQDCEMKGVELNFYDAVGDGSKNVFCLPFSDRRRRGLTLAKIHADLFGIKDKRMLSELSSEQAVHPNEKFAKELFVQYCAEECVRRSFCKSSRICPHR